MKPFLIKLSVSLFLLVVVTSCVLFQGPPTKDEVIEDMLMQNLNATHFKPQELNDTFSAHVYDLYLKRLDFNKKILLKEDVDKLSKYKYKIDDLVKQNSLEFFNLSMEIVTNRTKEDQQYYRDILSKPFTFTENESVELNPEKFKYAANKDELREGWRKYLKYQVLFRVHEAMNEQEKALAKKDTSYKVKTAVEIEADARKKVMKVQDELFDRLNKVDRDDRFSLYLNCLVGVFDPHTEYFRPVERDNFDMALSGQLEGIGAQLQEKENEIKVSSIVPGSPSWRQGKLKAGDIILKVAQGNGEPVEVSGMKLDNVVKLVRGKKGTEVRLTVKKVGGGTELISIIRDIVVLEETYAHSDLLKANGETIGYIKLPTFYADFKRMGGRSSATDVRNELIKLKAEHVDGVVLDLRDNGGGSLSDVVDMAGLFIDKGPVVQVKSRTGAQTILEDHDESIVYDGPLVVMVNSGSASASEIMAAAIQDYKRGIIMGSSSTFGKGTVQQFADLDEYLSSNFASYRPLGSVKVTRSKFYRINGGATQLKGVVPDIILPDRYMYLDLGERELDYPMKWDEISKAPYNTWKLHPLNYEKLRKNSEARTKTSEPFRLLAEEAQRFKKQKDDTFVTLNLEKYTAEEKKLETEGKKFEVLDKEIDGLTVATLSEDLRVMAADSSKMAREKDFQKRLKKDVHLLEAANVIKDEQ
ncbi:MAG TPA: carboxy terminal-processing peptidase [Bacteroidia bacterium]|jgi:carboxyl-terminal processing protease|nr:carboxy terminal-processing peptidase [Bacteroidia bacterium]